MADRQDLEKRVAELEQQLGRMQGRGRRGVRFRSSVEFMDLPLLAVASGPDLQNGELRGHARGVIAVGDVATGVIAVGGLARGLVAVGGVAVGGLTVGGVSLGLLGALGGLALGGVAMGGAAIGGVAMGGGAAGYYACGGGALGHAVVSPRQRDPEAEAFFREYGLEGACQGKGRR